MPWNKKLYPKNWAQISERIKKKAGYKCENCGSPSVKGKILTVHHLDGNPKNCNPKNLVALCQVCHLSIQARFKPGQLFLSESLKYDWLLKRQAEEKN